MQNNSNYRISYTGWYSMEEEVGEDLVFFSAHVESLLNDKIQFQVSAPFRKFRPIVVERQPAAHAILEQTKKQISRWGMQESEYVRELIECGIDLGTLFIEYIAQTYDLEAEANKWQRIASLPIEVNTLAEKLEDHAIDLKRINREYYGLCQQLDNTIRNLLVNQYAELFNGSSDTIRSLDTILSKHIANLATDLQNALEKARKE